MKRMDDAIIQSVDKNFSPNRDTKNIKVIRMHQRRGRKAEQTKPYWK